MINSLQSYYLSGVENNMGFLISILNDRKFKNGYLSTNFIKEKFKNGYRSDIEISRQVIENMSIASVLVFIKQLREINLSNNREFTVKILDQYTNVRIEKIDFSDQNFFILLKINNSNFILSSNWRLHQKLLVAEINDKREYFKISKNA